jgi:hypothetical protein
LRTQGSVKLVGIYLFILDEITIGNVFSEVVKGNKVILYSVLFRTTRLTGCAGYREMQIEVFVLHKIINYSGFARSGWGSKDNQFGHWELGVRS